jgi:hypothetical protein
VSLPPENRPAWHTLLAPLPPEAMPVRKPIGAPELLGQAHGAAIAGWQNLSLNLSAGTCWSVTGPEPRVDEPPAWESTPRQPTDDEAAALKRLVAEIVMRAG